MRIILNSTDCPTYTKAYYSIMEQLHKFANCDEFEKMSVNSFLEKHPEIIDSLELEIINSDKFKENLGYEETIRFYKSVLQSCPIEEMSSFISIVKNAEAKKGPTLYDELIGLFIERNINIIFN